MQQDYQHIQAQDLQAQDYAMENAIMMNENQMIDQAFDNHEQYQIPEDEE